MAKLHTREILNYELSCRPVLSERLVEANQIRTGDHIHWCHIGSWRDGIVIELHKPADGPVADLTLIRYGNSYGIFMTVREENWKINLTKDKLYRYEYSDHNHPPHVIITRAKACIGYGRYNALRNNNNDFCRWCVSGKHTYLCINETFLCSVIDESRRREDGTFCVMVTSLDDLCQGDHISWMPRRASSTKGQLEHGWRHSIVTDADQKVVDVVTLDDRSVTFEEIRLESLSFTDLLLRRYVYERCHMPDVVIDRARSKVGTKAFPEDCHGFARWCKLGTPADSESVDRVILSPEDGAVDGRPSKADRSAVSAKPFVQGMACATSTTTARAATGVAKATVQTSRALVRGTVEGAAAVAAVGVEAVVLAVDVGLTYRSFRRKQISKDELLGQNIQASIRSVSAASGSIGAGTAGAAIGTLAFPGVGTVIGGIIGGIAGGIAGQVGGHYAGAAVASAAQRPYENIFVEVIENL